jgi:uncharacterized damage-inducible protein DinB
MSAFVADALREFHRDRDLAERAMAQISDHQFFHANGAEDNSIAVIAKHLAGNLRSRWTDVLTSDGEKPERYRDGEFRIGETDTREALMARWDAGWRCLFDALEPLGEGDLDRTVTIRGEPHTVRQVVIRQLSHCGYHTGQIVLLAKHFAWDRWQPLSAPRRKSAAFTPAPTKNP